MGEEQSLALSYRQLCPDSPWISEMEPSAHPQEIAQSLRKASSSEIQIVDTPKALETAVNSSFAASRHQINRTLVRTYLHQHCGNLKVEVHFSLTHQEGEFPDDVIVRATRYVGCEVTD